MSKRNRLLRKILSLTLALAIWLVGFLPQAGTGVAASGLAADGAASKAMLRSLLTELAPEGNGDPVVRKELGSISAVAPGVVNAVYGAAKPAAPALDPLPALSNAKSIAVTGSAAEGSTVVISYRLNNGDTTEAGRVVADASSRFSFELQLANEDIYRITAVAERNGEQSPPSEPVIVEVDRTPPGEVENLGWWLKSNTTLVLYWTPPMVPHGQGGVIDDPSVASYRIYDNKGKLLKETTEKQVIFDNLEPSSRYEYRIRTVDLAGNESGYQTIYAGTSPANEVHLENERFSMMPVLSGAGNAFLYVDFEQQLYRINMTTGATRLLDLTADGIMPNGEITELAVNRSGSVIAFSSNASNLRAAKPPDSSEYAVYVYYTDSDTLELVSDPTKRAGKPSLNASGDLVVFAEDAQIYLYDLTGKSKKLVSKTDDNLPSNGISESPVISGDGKRIAYETNSTNLKGAPATKIPGINAVAVYDVPSDRHIWFRDYTGASRNLSLSADGKFVVFRSKPGSGWAKVQFIDMRDDDSANWIDGLFPDNRPQDQRKDKAYKSTSLSGDGRYVIATLTDNNPEGNIYLSSYNERFDRNTGNVDFVGNPGFSSSGAQIDEAGNRVIYVREGGLYTYCYGECQQGQYDEAIDSVEWSVHSSAETFSSLIPGNDMMIQAKGKPGHTVVAEIAYRKMVEGDPARIQTATKTIALPETASASGMYRAFFPITEGLTQVDAITAKLADGTKNTKTAARLPVDVAGKLSIDVQTEYRDLLGFSQFLLQSSNASTTTKPLAEGKAHYEFFWPATSDLTIVMNDTKGGLEVARQSGLTVNKGGTTSIVLTPVITASLSAQVLYGNTPVSAQVTFKDKNGTPLGHIATDAQGIALLEGRSAGEIVTVSVKAQREYAALEQTVTLGIGRLELKIQLVKIADTIRDYNIDYSRQVGRNSDKVPVIGSDVVITINAMSGLPIRAKLVKDVWQGGDSPESVEEWTVLTEATERAGTYTGVFRIAEGTAKLKVFTLEVDGTELPRVYELNKNVANRLQVTLDMPATSVWSSLLNDAQLDVISYDGFVPIHYESQTLHQDALSYLFDVPYAKTDYTIFLRPGYGKWEQLLSVQQTAASSEFGQTQLVTVVPRFQLAFALNVKNSAGQDTFFRAALRDSANQKMLWESNGYRSLTASLPLTRRNAAPETLQLTLSPENPGESIQTLDIQADSLNKRYDITFNKKPEAVLQGVVVGVNGVPADGSRVSATVDQDGFSKTYSAVSDRNGRYSLRVPAGEVKLRATDSSGSGSLSPISTIIATDEQNVDFSLKEPAKVNFSLYTKLGGGDWEGPIPWFGVTAVHLRVSMTPSIWKYEDSAYRTWATTGDTVRICVDGVEGGLPAKCQEAVIGEDNEATIEMRLANAGGEASFHAFQPDGTLIEYIDAVVSQLSDNSTKSIGLRFDKVKGAFIVPVQGIGNQRLLLKGFYRYAPVTATVDFVAKPGGMADLGDIRLQPIGLFGGPGNGLETSSDWSTPGGRLTVRAVYKNTTRTGEVRDARMVIELPQEAEFVPGTLVLNGKAATPNTTGMSLEVPIGTIAAGEQGSVQLQLKIQNEPNHPQVVVVGKMQYTAPESRDELLGSAVAELVPVTLRAPQLVTKPLFQVSGVVPAGAEVMVYDGTLMLGRTTASSAGTWNLQVEIQGTDVIKHRLRAETVVAGNRISGKEAIVNYDPNDPGLDVVTMKQGRSETQTFRPDDGVAVFPYVVVPGNPFTFTMKFRDPSRITNVRVQFGSSFAIGQLTGDIFTATMPMPEKIGPIQVTYDTKRLSWEPQRDLREPSSEEQIREDLHSSLKQYKTESINMPGEGGNPNDTLAISAMMTDEIRSNIKYKVSKISDYTPTEQELQKAKASGLPVYGLNVSHSLRGKNGTITFEAMVPEAVLQKGEGLKTAFELMSKALSASGPNAAGKENKVAALGAAPLVSGSMIKIGLTFGLDLVKGNADELWNLFDRFWQMKGISEEPELFDRVTKDLEWAQSLCDPDLIKYYSDWATEIGNDIMINETIKWGLAAVALVSGPATFGIGTVALFGFQYVASEILNDAVTYKLDALEEALSKVKCLPKLPKKPQADPRFIWDPSGYVYEGIHGNRLEGVTATVMEQDPVTKAWNVWDAQWYNQKNPLITDRQGRYAWDVPEGKWRVRYEKDGYITGYSNELDVPPPQLEVNVPLVSYLPPAVSKVLAEPGGAKVNVIFTKPIAAESLHEGAVQVTDAGGVTVTGAVYAKSPVTESGKVLSMAVEFTPDRPLTVDAVYKVTVSGQIVSYAGVAIGTDFEQNMTIVAGDVTPPGEVSGLSVGLFDGIATLSWADPADMDLSKARVRYKKAADASFSAPLEVSKGTQWASIALLEESSSYEFHVTSVDESGNESAGVRSSWTAAATEPDLTAPSSVRELNAVAASWSQLNVTWKDPAAPGLAKLRLSWVPESGNAAVQSVDLTKGLQAYSIAGLSASTTYNISIIAIDTNGNESDAASVTARTSAAGPGSNGGGGGGWPGPGPGPGHTGPPADGEWVISKDGGKFEAFEGKLQLQAAAGTFDGKTKLTVKELPYNAGHLPDEYYWLSQSYLMDAGQTKPKQPMKLTIQYDPALHKGMDARRLGIYFKEASSPSDWTYLGGILDEANRSITANIQAFGEYVVLLYDHPFADLTTHWSRQDVDVLVSRHIVDGVSADSFEPNRPITRAELTKLLVESLQRGYGEALSARANTTPAFLDVANDAWYAPFVVTAAKLGLVEGADNRFRPNDAVTREELAVLLRRFATLQGFPLESSTEVTSTLDRYADARDISGWAREAMIASVRQGWLQGMTETELEPRGEANRAQAATLLLRVLTSCGAIAK